MLDDSTADRERVTRLILCSGKVYYDVVGHEARAQATHVAVARLEQLYPFPSQTAAELVAGYPALRELVWLQEEPRNMGAWSYMAPRLREVVDPAMPIVYVGRPEAASPAEGALSLHTVEQARILAEALQSSAMAPVTH